MKISQFLIIILLPFFVLAQVVTVMPAFPKATDEVTITFDATKGTKGLNNCNCDVYLHTGVITDKSSSDSDWKHVVTIWGQANPAWKMTKVSGENNLYTYKISPSIKSFYSVGNSEIIEKMAFVFRNSNGSKEGKADGGKDIFIDVYPENTGLIFTLNSPTQKDLIVDKNAIIPIKATASQDVTFEVFKDNMSIYSSQGQELVYDLTASETGTHYIEINANSDSISKTKYFHYTVPLPNNIADLPHHEEDGITIKNDSTAFFSLYAPGKKNVFLIGDFNDWKINTTYQLNNTPDGKRWWIELSGLNPDEDYAFQYLVDGRIKIGDPYSNIVLDPWNDKYIPQDIFPNLKPYPTDKTEGIVSVFTTGKDDFKWENDNTNKPKKENLIIYELLMRDFLKDHSYNSLIDTFDYLERLGVNAIELMPVNEFEGNNSWGYNPSFHYALDKYYGTPLAFKNLVQEAHKRGISIILDVVFNHAFSQCPLAQLYWDESKFRPSADNPWLNQVARHPFNVGYDFNHESKATKYYVKKVLKHWMNEYKVDGFRFDLSKGFTQKQSNDNGQMAAYDISRIKILEDYADFIWSIDTSAYMILEHFAANSEEKVLSNYGMMLWGNMNHEYNEASMGYHSDLSYVTHKQRGWSKAHLVGYMESHDEERTMYKNLKWGKSSGNYSVKKLETALKRQELTGVFFFLLPGPKMIWEFGEVGYDYSINRCEDGSINDNCRLSPKPIRWDYYDDKARNDLYQFWSELIALKRENDIFNTTDFNFSLNSYKKYIHFNQENKHITIIGNFDVNPGNIKARFQHTGTWFDYFTGDSLNITDVNMQINLKAGEYRLYTDSKFLKGGYNSTVIQANEKYLIAYPNPVKDILTLHFHFQNNFTSKIELYDLKGQKLISKDMAESTSNTYNLDMKSIPNGIYILKISNGTVHINKKIIKLQ